MKNKILKIALPLILLPLLNACASGGYGGNNYAMNQPNGNRSQYDGYCYQPNNMNSQTKGTVIGAIAGGVLGSQVAASGHRTDGTIVGAVVGGIVGNQIGAHAEQTESANCLQNSYYLYENGFYEPSPPPSGHRIAYFYQRPSGMNYNHDNRH